MPDVVEIYICKPGQELKQGQLVVSNDIDSRDAARADAEDRYSGNPGIARIAYYAISENGDFKPYFSFTNPNAEAAPQNAGEAPRKKKSKKTKKPERKGLLNKVLDFYRE